MILNMTGGAGSSGKSDIIVYAPTGSTVTVQKGEEVPKTAPEKNGVWTFKGCGVGTWTVHASLGDQSATSTVEITEESQLMRYYVSINYTLYLLKDGEIGPEAGSFVNVAGCSFTDGEIRATNNSQTRNYCCFSNKIDASDFNTLKIKMSIPLIQENGYYPAHFGLSLNKPTTGAIAGVVTSTNFVAEIVLTDANSEVSEYGVDISSLNGSYYFSVVAIATYRISEIRLE